MSGLQPAWRRLDSRCEGRLAPLSDGRGACSPRLARLAGGVSPASGRASEGGRAWSHQVQPSEEPPRSLLLTHALLLGARPRAWGFRHTVGLPSASTHSITSRRGKGSAPTTAIWSLAPGAARDGPPQRHQGPAPPGSLWHCTAGSRRLRGAARQTPWVRGQGERTKWWSCRPRRDLRGRPLGRAPVLQRTLPARSVGCAARPGRSRT